MANYMNKITMLGDLSESATIADIKAALATELGNFETDSAKTKVFIDTHSVVIDIELADSITDAQKRNFVDDLENDIHPSLFTIMERTSISFSKDLP